ncbi:hypothetical protein B0J12DRAFT_681646 [Macrophomina phaseolina]|uniref:Secreted protein n=1 Tax=Macrophomina phaseolina TaxID=35725 RepID=A0ABQ8FW23_9PEZI|nr:hypothetical protein B0J12DRAFT_681646 [Macrophomina phaseolina]
MLSYSSWRMLSVSLTTATLPLPTMCNTIDCHQGVEPGEYQPPTDLPLQSQNKLKPPRVLGNATPARHHFCGVAVLSLGILSFLPSIRSS